MTPEQTKATIEVSLAVMEAARAQFLDGKLSEGELLIVCRVTQADIDKVKDANRLR